MRELLARFRRNFPSECLTQNANERWNSVVVLADVELITLTSGSQVMLEQCWKLGIMKCIKETAFHRFQASSMSAKLCGDEEPKAPLSIQILKDLQDRFAKPRSMQHVFSFPPLAKQGQHTHTPPHCTFVCFLTSDGSI